MSSRYHVHPIERRAQGLPCGFLTGAGPCALEALHSGEHAAAPFDVKALASIERASSGLGWPPRTATDPTFEMREAYRLLRSLTDEQRGLVLCWFCKSCWRYVGPGDTCHCENDE
jgi:hypothetical protein